MKIIELKNVTFQYEDEDFPVLKDLNFAVAPGECVVIAGENGAGKTTLLRLLAGLAFPCRGRYLWDGEEITSQYFQDNRRSKLFHKRVGLLFQNPEVMLFNGTVYDEIAFGPRQLGLAEEEIKRRTEDCLDLFNLRRLEGKAPYHLSGGQKKRVALAAVMSLNPEVLLLDEPFGGLDWAGQEQLLSFFSALKSLGKTILMATHNQEVRHKIADSSLVLGKCF